MVLHLGGEALRSPLGQRLPHVPFQRSSFDATSKLTVDSPADHHQSDCEILMHLGAQVSVAGRWQCTGTGLEAETISFRLELTQSGSSVSGFWIIGNDEVPIREGKLQDNRIELITFADDKQFTSVATVEGDEMKGTWKDDTGRSGSWQAKRLAVDPK